MVTLREAYLQMGVRGFRSAVSDWLTVHEAIDAPKVRFRNEGGELVVCKRGTRLNIIDRVLDPQLAVPFGMQPTLVREGPLFEAAFFPTSAPVLCEYAAAPGSMVLLSRRDAVESHGRAQKPIDHGESLIEDALAMGMTPPPVLGRFFPEAEHVEWLLAAARGSLRTDTNPWDLMEAWGMSPHLGTQWGAKFGGLVVVAGDARPVRIRIPDPVTESARAAELQAREHLDMQGIILCDFIDFFENELKLSEAVSVEERSLEERLLTTVSNIYLGYVRSRAGMFDDVKISDRGFAVDSSLVREDVKATFSSENNQKIFQMLLQSLYSPKKKPTGTLTEAILATLNRVRYTINAKISEGYETSVPTYAEYLMMSKQ